MKRITILILIIISCNKKDNCAVDIAFKKQFDKNINFLIASETDTNFEYQTSNKITVIYFLESITGIKSQIYWGDIFSYTDNKLFEEDLKKWNNWYHENKCEMTMVKADSLFKNYKFNE